MDRFIDIFIPICIFGCTAFLIVFVLIVALGLFGVL